MNQRKLTIIAIACGAVCAACVLVFMANVQGQANAARAEALARYGGEQVEACVALRDIAAGERVDAGAVATKLWIADLLPADAFSSSGDVVGKTATSAIFAGEIVTSRRFEVRRGTLEVPAGKVAISVPVKAVQAVGGAVAPGASVDVYASGDASTSIVARDVTVLDTSLANGSKSLSEMNWVTLAVDPEKAQELVAATARTELYLVLPGEATSKDDAEGSAKPGTTSRSEQSAAVSTSSSASSSVSAGLASNASAASASSPAQESRGGAR